MFYCSISFLVLVLQKFFSSIYFTIYFYFLLVYSHANLLLGKRKIEEELSEVRRDLSTAENKLRDIEDILKLDFGISPILLFIFILLFHFQHIYHFLKILDHAFIFLMNLSSLYYLFYTSILIFVQDQTTSSLDFTATVTNTKQESMFTSPSPNNKKQKQKEKEKETEKEKEKILLTNKV